MPRLPIRYAVLLALALPCAPASAQTLDQLDALSDATATEEGGIALARTQAQRGQYLEALSSLERVLGAFPTSRGALLDHAIYLCMVDDRQGGRVELQLLRERDYDARQLSDAQAVCDGVPTVAAPARLPTLAPAPPPRSQVAAPEANSASSGNTKPKVD